MDSPQDVSAIGNTIALGEAIQHAYQKTTPFLPRIFSHMPYSVL